MTDSDDLRVAMFCGVSSSIFLWALNAFASAAGRSCRRRRSNSARLRLPSSAKRASHSLRAAAPRLPASRQAFRTSSGTENGSSEMPSFSLAPLSSSAPSASPCALFVPALVGAPITDRGLAGDQRRLVGFLRARDRGGDRLLILAVDQFGLPARGLETLHLIDRIRERGRTVDRNAVVVVEHDQLVELPVSGQRDRFLRDALHQVAVGAKHVGMMVDDLLAEFGGEHFLRDRKADRGRDALAERSRRGLDALGVKVFGMPRRQRSQLAEMLELVERHVGIAGEIEQRIEQHRAVPGRKNEAVAVRPFRIGRVEFQELREQHGGDVGRAHRQAGMAGLCLLDGIHRQPADRVGHTGMIDIRHDKNPREMRCLVATRRSSE